MNEAILVIDNNENIYLYHVYHDEVRLEIEASGVSGAVNQIKRMVAPQYDYVLVVFRDKIVCEIEKAKKENHNE